MTSEDNQEQYQEEMDNQQGYGNQQDYGGNQ